jgi:transposase
MPKTLELVPHLPSEILQDRYRKAKDPVEVRRWHLLWKVSQGWSAKDSALAVGLNYDYARRFIRKYNEMGEVAVQNQRNKNSRKKGGSQSLLNPEQLNRLKEALKEKPVDGGVWTGPKVARWIEKETGREKIYNQRGWDYLQKINQ